MAKTQIMQSALRIGITLILIYIAFVVLVYFCQRRMLYAPSKHSMDTLLAEARTLQLEPWRNDSGDYIGWMYGKAANGPRALILHGNAGCAINRDYYVQSLTNAGFKEIFILEYPGYGARPGSPSQATLCAAADEAFALLEKRGPVYLVGESLGTGVAAYLAGKHSNSVAGLLMVTPYHNMTDVGQYHMPILPVRLLLKDRFPSSDFLQHYHGPMAVLLAGNDVVIPNHFGRRLYDAYSGPKKLWLIPQAGHNDVFMQPAAWWSQVAEFWRGGSSHE